MPSDLLLSHRVTFEEGPHRYHFDDGAPVDASATDALHFTGYVSDEWYTEWARERGRLVHLATEFFDRGELDEDTLDPALVPYLRGYKSFLRESGAAWDAIELRLGDRARRVAGTLDRLGAFGLADIKTGGREPWHAIQTAIYALLAQTNGLILSARRVKRWALYLRADGTFRLEPHEDPNDLKVAEAVMAVAVDKVARGIVAPRWERRAA